MYGPIPLSDEIKNEMNKPLSRERIFQSRLAFALKNRALDGSLSIVSKHQPTKNVNRNVSSLQDLMSHTNDKFPIRACNIVDPFDAANNLGRSLNLQSFQRMKNMFSNGHRCIMEILSSTNKHNNSIIINKLLFHIIYKNLLD